MEATIHDTTIGLRFVNALMKEKYDVDSMPEIAENVATQFKIECDALCTMCIGVGQGIALIVERV